MIGVRGLCQCCDYYIRLQGRRVVFFLSFLIYIPYPFLPCLYSIILCFFYLFILIVDAFLPCVYQMFIFPSCIPSRSYLSA